MNELIRAVGDDLFYTTRKTHCWIALHTISRVYPVYAVDENGKLWRCTHDHPGAKVVSYILVTHNGDQFSCAAPDELRKLGLDTGNAENPRSIGFLHDREAAEKAVIDLSE